MSQIEMSEPDLAGGLIELAQNLRLAHHFFFQHRHETTTPPFHYEAIDLLHSPHPFVQIEAFRGGAKSTLAEESICIEACFGWFRNGIILSASRDQAIDRLRSVKYELEHNDRILAFFGYLGGTSAEVWNEDEIILSNGVRIQALGRGQSFRGTKHLEARPDRLWYDDLEDDESARNEESCEAVKLWFLKVALPALDNTRARIRGLATPLHPKALVMQLRNMPNWVSKIYPIKSINPETGEWIATWPSKYPLTWIDEKETEMRLLGATQEFAQEYMCSPEDPATKLFVSSHYKVVPHVRTWQAVLAAYDPARTINKKSATTGKAVFSWIGSKLVVWDGGGYLWLPDDIINDMFATHEQYNLVTLGVESQGLHEFIMQPLRQQQALRHSLLPVEDLKPPKDKQNFIRGLQPFFAAGEIEFATDLPDARAQLMGFPSGKIDFPNALAYALLMRPGAPVYMDFDVKTHVFARLRHLKNHPLHMVVGATNQHTTGMVLQFIDGVIYVLADYAREGSPIDRLSDIIREASIAFERTPGLLAVRDHFKDFDTVGLRGAASKIPLRVRRGGERIRGRDEVRRLLRTSRQGDPSLCISGDAKWTCNGFAAGYSRALTRGATLSDEPKPGVYDTLIGALESFCGMMHYQDTEDDQPNYAYTESGQRFISSRAVDRVPQRPTKDNWHGG